LFETLKAPTIAAPSQPHRRIVLSLSGRRAIRGYKAAIHDCALAVADFRAMEGSHEGPREYIVVTIRSGDSRHAPIHIVRYVCVQVETKAEMEKYGKKKQENMQSVQ